MSIQHHDEESAALAGALRAQRSGVSMTTPIDEVVRRGRVLRARRHRVPALSLAAVAVTAVALSAAGMGSGASPAAPQTGTTMGAAPGTQPTSPYWSVSLAADDTITVTLHQLQDAAGLQAALRSDGLPAAVSFSGKSTVSACQAYPATEDLLRKVAHPATSSTYVFNPSALPQGAGVLIYDGLTPHGGPKSFALKVVLVHTSKACTGS